MRSLRLAELPLGGGVPWLAPALEGLAALASGKDPRFATFIDPARPLHIARAPGRLDVMGGIADYSGSLVLQLPLERATFAILQPRGDRRVEIVSVRESGPSFHQTDLDRLVPGSDGLPGKPDRVAEGWSRYVTGIIGESLRLAGVEVSRHARGFRLLILSTVPEGKGISSSAALEVATMGAVADHLGLSLTGEELAAACQWVENHVVGAPCGIMDQLTSTLGEEGRLLRIRCRPALVEGSVDIPQGYRFFDIDSGVRHAVGGSDYISVRAAAFMGRALLRRYLELPELKYLAEVAPAEFEVVQSRLPEWMSGSEFLAEYGSHGDEATRVAAERLYPVRAATRHPVLENARVERFARLLEELPRSPAAALEMGELMYSSHESYSACGLGSGATDRLVEMVRSAGPAAGLFGAKITGGGSGGTVAVFGRETAAPEVQRIAAEYVRESRQPERSEGSALR